MEREALGRHYDEEPIDPVDPDEDATKPADVIDLDEVRQQKEKEQALVSAAKQGDQKAFGKLYNYYRPMLYRSALQRVQYNQAQAEDAVQETFMKAWKALPGYEEQGNLKNFLFTILVNEIRDAGRKTTVRSKKFSTLTETYPDTVMSEPPLAPDVHLSYQEQLAHIQTILAQLDPVYGNIFRLKFVEHLADEETAKTLNIKPVTARQYIFKLRRMLQKKLGKDRENVF